MCVDILSSFFRALHMVCAAGCAIWLMIAIFIPIIMSDSDWLEDLILVKIGVLQAIGIYIFVLFVLIFFVGLLNANKSLAMLACGM